MKLSISTAAILGLLSKASAHDVLKGNHVRSHQKSQSREHHPQGGVRTGQKQGQQVREHHSRNHDEEQHEARVHHKDRAPRVAGGGFAAPYDYPYYVDLGGCGGSLIAPGVVLGAAHCGDYTGIGTINVGGYHRAETDYGAVEANVVQAVNHTKWDGNAYDVQLMRLDQPLELVGDVYLLLNDDRSVPDSSDVMTVIGMGWTAEGGPDAETLKELQTPFMDYDSCYDLWGDGIEDESMICTGAAAGTGACAGDSGGPMVIKNGYEHVLVGTVSHGDGCGKPPSIYVRVSAVFPWIQSVVCDTWNIDAPDICDY